MRYSKDKFVYGNSNSKFELIEEDILEYIKNKDYVSFKEICDDFENTYGDKCWRKLDNNIIIWLGMSDDLVKILLSLYHSGKIYLKPTTILTYLCDGSILNVPIVKKHTNYKKDHWLPTVMRSIDKLPTENQKVFDIVNANIQNMIKEGLNGKV